MKSIADETSLPPHIEPALLLNILHSLTHVDTSHSHMPLQCVLGALYPGK